MKTTTYTKLTNIQKKVLDAAEQAMQKAYNPYSHFFVGSALLTKDGTMIGWSNVENAAYGSCICAERSAIVRANAMGQRVFTTIAVIARWEDFNTKKATAPCGSCRQVIYEFSQIAGINTQVILSNTKKNKVIITSINELLPLAFGPKDLEVEVAKYRK